MNAFIRKPMNGNVSGHETGVKFRFQRVGSPMQSNGVVVGGSVWLLSLSVGLLVVGFGGGTIA